MQSHRLIVPEPNLAQVVQLCDARHELVYHPASARDIERSINENRRASMLARLEPHIGLPEGPPCP